eukprot:8228073-Pyramimonas_sp.AAC.2
MELELCDVLGIKEADRAPHFGRDPGYRIVAQPVLEYVTGGASRALRKLAVWVEELRFLRRKGHRWDSRGGSRTSS